MDGRRGEGSGGGGGGGGALLRCCCSCWQVDAASLSLRGRPTPSTYVQQSQRAVVFRCRSCSVVLFFPRPRETASRSRMKLLVAMAAALVFLLSQQQQQRQSIKGRAILLLQFLIRLAYNATPYSSTACHSTTSPGRTPARLG